MYYSWLKLKLRHIYSFSSTNVTIIILYSHNYSVCVITLIELSCWHFGYGLIDNVGDLFEQSFFSHIIKSSFTILYIFSHPVRCWCITLRGCNDVTSSLVPHKHLVSEVGDSFCQPFHVTFVLCIFFISDKMGLEWGRRRLIAVPSIRAINLTENKRHSPNVGSMSAHCRRWWASIEPTLDERLVFVRLHIN